MSTIPENEKVLLLSKPAEFGEKLIQVLLKTPPGSAESGFPENVEFPGSAGGALPENVESAPTAESPGSAPAGIVRTPVPLKPTLPKKPFGLKGPKRGKPVPKKKRPARLSAAKRLQAAELMARDRVNPLYWELTPDQRNLEFAKLYVARVRVWVGDGVASRWHEKLGVDGLTKLRGSKWITKITNARVKADIEGARYDDWIASRFDVWEATEKMSYPTPHYLGSDDQSEIWISYLLVQKRSMLRFSRSDIEATDLPYLLPENFRTKGHDLKRIMRENGAEVLSPEDLKTFHEYEAQCKLYEDFMIPDMQRMVRASMGRVELIDLVKKAIAQKIMPSEWVLGFGSHHHLTALKAITL